MRADSRRLGRHRAAVALCALPAVVWLLWLVRSVGGPLGWGLAVLALACAGLPFGRSLHRLARVCCACAVEAAVLACGALGVRLTDAPGAAEALGVTGMALVVLLTASSQLDLLLAIGRRAAPTAELPDPVVWPGICVQVPAHDEPPQLLLATLRQLLEQDYPGRWMIQVIDNNTPDRETWIPVRDFCSRHPERVDFIHLENWPGHKAGALNEGIRRLPDWVEHIAVVDADYLVDPHFLTLAARHLADPAVAFAQVPQHYRQWRGSRFHEGVFHMYEQYYAAIVPARAEANGLICVGTMAVLRRRAVEKAGLWDETSVTEDAELSLRLLGQGWRGVIDPRIMGSGLMPFDFAGLRRQRFRWAFGMIHVLRKHRGALLGPPRPGRSLSTAQRLSYWGLAVQYLTELVPLAATSLVALVLVNTAVMSPGTRLMLVAALGLYTLAALARLTLAVRDSGRSVGTAVLAALTAHWAQSWTMAHACLSALAHRRAVFLRTPKTAGHSTITAALGAARTETTLAVINATLAVCALYQHSPLLAAATALPTAVYGCGPVMALAYQRSAAPDSPAPAPVPEPVSAAPYTLGAPPATASSSAGEAISVDGLCHRYGDREVLTGLSFNVAAGEFFGILGPNGAGKSTTLEILEGLRRPTAGLVRVLGETPWPRNPKLLHRLGVQLQSSAFFDHLTTREQLETFAALHRVARAKAGEVLELVGLTEQAGTREARLSGGQRQRLAIACALVHEPEILFLDEPTAALDAQARHDLWDVLGAVQQRGTTIVYTTHHLDEAEILCDRIAVLDGGRILDLATPTELIHRHGGTTRVNVSTTRLTLRQAESLAAAERVHLHDQTLTITTHKPDLLLTELAALHSLHGIRMHSPTLEDAFLTLTDGGAKHP
ncbi:ATP-binding cassette domain-containing protein [Streptomyces sp. CA-181903]|uniref:ATP-binding cassette domain-containing protein n=1 Tax=Streptomyces sp. CA-181903 TaxID=3240055 RepID=UPI003D92170B